MLTATEVKVAKQKEKPYKLTDGQGLYLQVTPTGGKRWRFKYRFDDKEKLLAFGTYPEISLAEAREKREAARKLVANGIDPGEIRKAEKEAKAQPDNTFEIVAREWHEKFSPRWSPVHAETTIKRLERDAFPWIGERPIAEIKAPELLAVLRRVESRGALETAHRVKTICGQVFRYAVATGRAERDPCCGPQGRIAAGDKEPSCGSDGPEGGRGPSPGHRQLPGFVRGQVRFAACGHVLCPARRAAELPNGLSSILRRASGPSPLKR